MPVLNAEGDIVEWFEAASDITERRRAEKALSESESKQKFLLNFSDTLRALADPVQVQSEAARMLGEHLGVSRVMYGEVAGHGEDLIVERNYVTNGAPILTGRYRMADFGPALVAALNEGRTVVIPDIASSDAVSVAEREAYAALGIAALLGVPLRKGGRLVSNFNIHSAAPREWSDNEIERDGFSLPKTPLEQKCTLLISQFDIMVHFYI